MQARVPVRIRLESSWDEERVDQLFHGELYRKGTAVYVRYTETDEQSGTTRTLVKLSDQEIKIMRHGQVESEQYFALHEARRGHYRTELGTLPIVTHTLRMDMRLIGGIGSAAWTYSLLVADEPAGTFNLKLTIQEEPI